MRYALFLLALVSAFAIQAGELKLEFAGRGIAGNQVRIAVNDANAPERFPPDFTAAAFEIGENAVTKSIHLH